MLDFATVILAILWFLLIWLMSTALTIFLVNASKELGIPKTRTRFGWIAVRILFVQIAVFVVLLTCGLSLEASLGWLAAITVLFFFFLMIMHSGASGGGGLDELGVVIVIGLLSIGLSKLILGSKESYWELHSSHDTG